MIDLLLFLVDLIFTFISFLLFLLIQQCMFISHTNIAAFDENLMVVSRYP